MKIRDSIHGSIGIEPFELPIIDSRYFQRLRQIKQLGFAENSFPGATHNRLIHSLGAMKAATLIFENIFGENTFGYEEVNSSRSFTQSAEKTAGASEKVDLPASAFEKFRATIRLAALLHDIGHGPLSHTTEFAMPGAKALNLPSPITLPNP